MGAAPRHSYTDWAWVMAQSLRPRFEFGIFSKQTFLSQLPEAYSILEIFKRTVDDRPHPKVSQRNFSIYRQRSKDLRLNLR